MRICGDGAGKHFERGNHGHVLANGRRKQRLIDAFCVVCARGPGRLLHCRWRHACRQDWKDARRRACHSGGFPRLRLSQCSSGMGSTCPRCTHEPVKSFVRSAPEARLRRTYALSGIRRGGLRHHRHDPGRSSVSDVVGHTVGRIERRPGRVDVGPGELAEFDAAANGERVRGIGADVDRRW